VKLVLLAEAEAELDDAAAWYDERRDGLGDELLLVVRTGLEVIVEAPEAWPLWPGALARIPPIRRFVLPRFPYCCKSGFSGLRWPCTAAAGIAEEKSSVEAQFIVRYARVQRLLVEDAESHSPRFDNRHSSGRRRCLSRRTP
jgi:hypothetical protein